MNIVQQELFEIEEDNRVQKLRDFIHKQLRNHQCWFPNVKELIEIGDQFGVIGSVSLELFEQAVKDYCKALEGDCVEGLFVEEDCCDESELQHIIHFYRNLLKIP